MRTLYSWSQVLDVGTNLTFWILLIRLSFKVCGHEVILWGPLLYMVTYWHLLGVLLIQMLWLVSAHIKKKNDEYGFACHCVSLWEDWFYSTMSLIIIRFPFLLCQHKETHCNERYIILGLWALWLVVDNVLHHVYLAHICWKFSIPMVVRCHRWNYVLYKKNLRNKGSGIDFGTVAAIVGEVFVLGD